MPVALPHHATLADSLDRLRRDPASRLVARIGVERDGRVTAPHVHPEGQLFGAIRGVLTVGTDAGIWVLPASHAIWVPPWQRHALRSHGAFEGHSVYVSEQACSALPRESCAIRFTPLLREAIARAASWSDETPSPARHRIVDLIFDEIRETPDEPIGLPLPRDARLQRVARALLDDLSDQRDLAAWAQFGALSARTLTRRFFVETGFTFAEWRQRARLMRAVEMLAAGDAVTNVALSLGYDNVSAFIAMFRRAHGVTPARFLQGRESL